MKKKILTFIKYTFLICACFLIVKTIDFKVAAELFKQVSLVFFALTVAVCILDKVVMGLKWNILLKGFNIDVPVRAPVIANLRAKVFQFFSPSTLGEDVYKVYYLKNCGASVVHVVASIVIERSLGALSSLAIIFLLIYFPLSKLNIPNSVIFTSLGLFFFSGLIVSLSLIIKITKKNKSVPGLKFIHHKIRNKLDKFLQAISKISQQDKRLWNYFYYSIFEKIFYGTAIYLAAKAVGLTNLDYMYFVAATPLLALLERLPISVSAIGIREGLFVVLFQPYFLDPTIPITIALVLRLAEVFMTVFCVFLWMGRHDGKLYGDQIQAVNKEVASLRAKEADG